MKRKFFKEIFYMKYLFHPQCHLYTHYADAKVAIFFSVLFIIKSTFIYEHTYIYFAIV